MNASRQHFEMTARVLRETDLTPEARAELVSNFIYEFKRANGRFDSERFTYAAQPVDERGQA